VLQALLKSVESTCSSPDNNITFILVTGDLAFSGKSEEYELAHEFLNELSRASQVSLDQILAVPGNHDCDRQKQVMCHYGARARLITSSDVDAFIGNTLERGYLLQRQSAFWNFSTKHLAPVSFNEDHLVS
jgi:DNA repair exonuclease SbcCD nuclease subunit